MQKLSEPKLGDSWWRYNDGGSSIWLEQLYVTKITPKCVYLCWTPLDRYRDPDWPQKVGKRVLKDARRRYAYPTKELAANSYRARKRAQRQHLQAAWDKLLIMEECMGESGEINTTPN